jgi:hypothetical protein
LEPAAPLSKFQISPNPLQTVDFAGVSICCNINLKGRIIKRYANGSIKNPLLNNAGKYCNIV